MNGWHLEGSEQPLAGGFIKRETRPSTKETLTSRLMDRPIRPMFPPDYLNEIQIMAQVISADKENDPDVLAIIGASAALTLAPVPFVKTVGAVRLGRVGGQFIAFPTLPQMEESDLDLIVAGTDEAICMIEGFARELPEDVVAAAVEFAHGHIVEIIDLIEELREKAGLGKKEAPPAPAPNPLAGALNALTAGGKVASSGCNLNNATVTNAQLLSPMPQFCNGAVSEMDAPVGQSLYNALQVTFNHRVTKGLTALVSYTYSKFLDNVEGNNGWSYNGPSNWGQGTANNTIRPCSASLRSIAGLDASHNLRASS